jgi:hypothetical protein
VRRSKLPSSVRNRLSSVPRSGPAHRDGLRSCCAESSIEFTRNLGRLADIFRRCLEKKPLLRVEKDGYPLTWSLLAFAAAQDILLLPSAAEPLISPNTRRGEEPRLLPVPVVRPGVDQPPPGRGEGERESDMGRSSNGVDAAGIGGREGGRTKVPEGTEELVPRPLSESAGLSLSIIRGWMTAEDRRR